MKHNRQLLPYRTNKSRNGPRSERPTYSPIKGVKTVTSSKFPREQGFQMTGALLTVSYFGGLTFYFVSSTSTQRNLDSTCVGSTCATGHKLNLLGRSVEFLFQVTQEDHN